MDVDAFMRDGYAVVRGAFDARTARACREIIWTALEACGVRSDDRSTWHRPVIRMRCPVGEPFTVAATSPKLLAAYDELIGARRWVRPVTVGGSMPVRFPSEVHPGRVGYHIDGSWRAGDAYRTDVRCKGRGLLAVFLFSDVDPDDAPGRMVLGSHLYVPRVLVAAESEGLDGVEVVTRLRPTVLCRRTAETTGQAGDVFLCHPFLVHTATWPHRGTEPRMVAQVDIEVPAGFAIDGTDRSPVGRAIVAGLRGTD